MRLPENHLGRQWAEQRIEAFVDGLLSWHDRRRFEKMMASDESLASEVAAATELRDALRSLERPMCPPHVQNAIDRTIGPERSVSRVGAGNWVARLGLGHRPAVRLAMITVSAVMVLVAVVWLLRGPSPIDRQRDDVQLALGEVKLALSYVSLAANETGQTLSREVVGRNVIVPIRRALDYADVGGRAERSDRPPAEELENENPDQQ